MAQDYSQYKQGTLTDEQTKQAAATKAIGLGQGVTTSPQSMTWDDYSNWWSAALADGKLKRSEWKDLGNRGGFSGKAARKAFNQGGASWQNYLNNVLRPKLQRNSYIYRDPESGRISMITQGDANYNEEAFNNAQFKGTDSTKLANEFNKALADARKNANITYKKGADGNWGYYTSYNVGDFAVNDLNVTDSDWFKSDTDRQKNAQLAAYKSAVDNSYQQNPATDYLGEDGISLLQKIGYQNIDEVRKFSNLKDNDEDNAKKDIIRKNVTSAIRNHFNSLAKNDKGVDSWDNSVKADATWRHLMDYYNTKNIPWLDKLDWQAGNRYSEASRVRQNTPSNPKAAGSLIGLQKTGGNILESLDNKYFKKGGKLKFKYGITENV